MISILLHLILPMFFYTMITTIAFAGFGLGALEATALSAILVSPVFFGIYVWDQKRRGAVPAVRLSMGGCSLYVALLGVGLCILGNQLVEYTGLTEWSRSYQEVSRALYAPGVFMQLLCTGILIPMAEELIFRGMIFASLRECFRFTVSAVLSALLFGLFHGNIPQGVYGFILGLAMAWVYENCRTLAAPYLFHISANIFSVFMTNMPFWGNLLSGEEKTVTAAATVVSALVSLACVLGISMNNNMKEEMV